MKGEDIECGIEICDPFEAKKTLGTIWKPGESSHIEGRGLRAGEVLVD